LSRRVSAREHQLAARRLDHRGEVRLAAARGKDLRRRELLIGLVESALRGQRQRQVLAREQLDVEERLFSRVQDALRERLGRLVVRPEPDQRSPDVVQHSTDAAAVAHLLREFEVQSEAVERVGETPRAQVQPPEVAQRDRHSVAIADERLSHERECEVARRGLELPLGRPEHAEGVLRSGDPRLVAQPAVGLE